MATDADADAGVVRIDVETWAPDYGATADDAALAVASVAIDPSYEVPPEQWAPRGPDATLPAPAEVRFVDGVRRVEARLWVSLGDASPRQGIAASWAAGVVACDGRARLVDAEVRRGLFVPGDHQVELVTGAGRFSALPVAGDEPDRLALALQKQMADLEALVSARAGAEGGAGCLVVVDGPLAERRHVPGAVGYVKTHHVGYLPEPLAAVVGALAPGQRTPVFVIGGGRFDRWSWYLRLPGGADHAWGGVVRLEASSGLPLAEVVRTADATCAVLPRFASRAHQDPRAPQNLHPIAGLERELRRRLGDAALVERSIRRAATGLRPDPSAGADGP